MLASGVRVLALIGVLVSAFLAQPLFWFPLWAVVGECACFAVIAIRCRRIHGLQLALYGSPLARCATVALAGTAVFLVLSLAAGALLAGMIGVLVSIGVAAVFSVGLLKETRSPPPVPDGVPR